MIDGHEQQAAAAMVLKGTGAMGEKESEPEPRLVRRAERYRIHLSMFYRRPGDRHWRQGRTENISRSGVLFRSEQTIPVQARIDMLLELPVEVGGGHNATVICRGRVIRLEAIRDDDASPAVAATISGYRLTHSQLIDPRRV